MTEFNLQDFSDQKLVEVRDLTLRALQANATELHALKAGLAGSLRQKLQQDLDELSEACRALPPISARPLSQGGLAPYVSDGSPDVLRHCVFGLAPLPRPSLKPGAIYNMQPLLEASGVIILNTDNESLDVSRAIIRDVLLRAALALPHSMGFTIYDPKEMDSTVRFAAQLPRLRPRSKQLSETLEHISDDIRRIGRDVVGTAERFLDLSNEARSGEHFELLTFIDFPHAYHREGRTLEALAQIANLGPRAGRYVILENNLDSAPLADLPLGSLRNPVVIECRKSMGHSALPPMAAEEITPMLQRAKKSGADSAQNDFASAASREPLMQESSADCIKTTVGERLTLGFGRVADRGEVSHGVIAGQVGSGKSHLLHVIIAGLTRRYSPQELRLYLIDAKQGVEFKAYEGLPHAEVVSLRTRPILARRILADFRAEMERRYDLFKAENVNNLSAYRAKTGVVMPRMLMIIDEYQLIFENDQTAGRAELEPILSKGRAAGMHLLLCAQRFDVDGMRPDSFNDIHLRVSLSLAQDYIQRISAFSSEGKKLIRGLGSYEVVINDRGGEDGANQRGKIMHLARRDDQAVGQARSDDASLESVLQQIRLACGPDAPAPVVLDGTMSTTLAQNAFVMQYLAGPPPAEALQRIAHTPARDGGFEDREWSPGARPMVLWAGRNFDVFTHAGITLRRRPGQNLLMLGQRSDQRAAMLAQMLVSLVATTPACDLDITLIDLMDSYMPGAGLVEMACDWLRSKGAQVTIAKAESRLAALEAFAAGHESERTGLLILCEPDRWSELVDGYDGYMPPSRGEGAILRDILRRGAERSRHVILSISSISSLASFMNASRELRLFTHRLVQQLSTEESATVFNKAIGTDVEPQTDHPMGALYHDANRPVETANFFAGYAVSADLRQEPTREAFADLLARHFSHAGDKHVHR